MHSQDSEHALIGALLQDPDAIDRVGGLKPEHFYAEANRAIYAEIIGMVTIGLPVDVITVAESLHTKGLGDATGGLAYLGGLAATTPGSRNVGMYAKAIIDKALERSLIAASEIIRESVKGTGSTAEKVHAAQSAVMGITEAVSSNAPKTLKEALTDAVDVLSSRASGGDMCYPTGFTELDRQLLGGLRPGNLVVLAGRPAMGKTSLGVNIALSVAKAGYSTLFLSLEMPQQELTDRLISQTGSVYLSDVIAGNLAGESGERIMYAVSKLQDVPLSIDDQGALTLFDVASKARTVKRKRGLSLLVVDYLQLMSGNGGDNRNQEIERITRGLKALAKELSIPIIVLSQLSRKCEERTNKRPMSSDLRESGAIEQDADIIIFVYRDEEYNPESPDKGTAEIIITKNRQGRTGMVRLDYQGCYTRFGNLPPDWRPEETEKPTRKRGFYD